LQDFYAAFIVGGVSLKNWGISVHIREMPCEIPKAIAFSQRPEHGAVDGGIRESLRASGFVAGDDRVLS